MFGSPYYKGWNGVLRIDVELENAGDYSCFGQFWFNVSGKEVLQHFAATATLIVYGKFISIVGNTSIDLYYMFN